MFNKSEWNESHLKVSDHSSKQFIVDLFFYVPPIVCGDSVLVFVLVCIILCPFYTEGKKV